MLVIKVFIVKWDSLEFKSSWFSEKWYFSAEQGAKTRLKQTTLLTFLSRDMETLVYHLNHADLTAAFLESIRPSIDAERFTLTIAPETQDTKRAFEEKIMDSVHDSVSFVFKSGGTHDEFEEFSTKLLCGKSVEPEQYKQVRP